MDLLLNLFYGFLGNVLNWLLSIAHYNPFWITWTLFIKGGWIFFAYIIARYTPLYWLLRRRMRWEHHQEFMFLAVDVPKGNEQTPKAVENIFSHLAGAHGSVNMYEKWWKGEFQLSFSLELVSLGGYIKFIIRTPVKFRDLVEASIYAHYPDAQISEVEDYTSSVPRYYPNATHLMWATEFILVKQEAFPLRTYPAFEDKLSQEFKDPMSSALEDLSRLQEGEQAWFQIIVIPIGQKEWPKHSQHLVDKMLGRGHAEAPSILERALMAPIDLLSGLVDFLTTSPGEHAEKKEEEKPPTFMTLPTHEKAIIEGIGMKMSKIGFEVKMRFVYVARRELYFPARVVNGFIGAIKQFNTVDLNALKPDTKRWTKVNYDFQNFRLNYRRRNLMRYYRGRSERRGRNPFVLNIEELATLWHFPVMQVKAPQVKKTEAKRAEPPFSLPVVK